MSDRVFFVICILILFANLSLITHIAVTEVVYEKNAIIAKIILAVIAPIPYALGLLGYVNTISWISILGIILVSIPWTIKRKVVALSMAKLYEYLM